MCTSAERQWMLALDVRLLRSQSAMCARSRIGLWERREVVMAVLAQLWETALYC